MIDILNHGPEEYGDCRPWSPLFGYAQGFGGPMFRKLMVRKKGSFVRSLCPLCKKVMDPPIVLPGEPEENWRPLTFVEGWGLMHCWCADVLMSGDLQPKLFDFEAAA